MGLGDVYAETQRLTALISDREYKDLKIGDELSWTETTSSNKLIDLGDKKAQETALVEVDIDDEDVTNEMRMDALKKISEIEEKYNRLEQEEMQRAKKLTDWLEKQRTLLETNIEHDRADLEGLNELLDKILENMAPDM